MLFCFMFLTYMCPQIHSKEQCGVKCTARFNCVSFLFTTLTSWCQLNSEEFENRTNTGCTWLAEYGQITVNFAYLSWIKPSSLSIRRNILEQVYVKICTRGAEHSIRRGLSCFQEIKFTQTLLYERMDFNRCSHGVFFRSAFLRFIAKQLTNFALSASM